MNPQATMVGRIAELKRELVSAVSSFRIDDAENAYLELTEQCGVDPDSDMMLPSRVMIGIFRGRLRDMLLMLNDLGEDRALGLKAVCLHLLDDPLWEGIALHVEETSTDPEMRQSMQTLLARAD
jgi:hypothetical protein